MERIPNADAGTIEMAKWLLTHVNLQDDPSNMKYYLANINN